MAILASRFRAADVTNPEHASATAWAVEVWSEADRRWKHYLVNSMPVYRPTRERAQELVDRLIRGEDILECQIRPRPDFWDRLNEPKGGLSQPLTSGMTGPAPEATGDESPRPA